MFSNPGLNLALAETEHRICSMYRKTDVLDRDFAAARASLLDLAAFLDRVERAGGEGDFRWDALLNALPLLEDAGVERTRRILEALSFPGETPTESVIGKAACGAPDLNA